MSPVEIIWRDTVVSGLLLLLFALYIFHNSLRILKNDLFGPKPEDLTFVDRISKNVLSTTGLLVWFSVGVFAFISSIGSFFERIILHLQ